VEDALVSLRQKHSAWGARKLRRRLSDLGQAAARPATSTITGILHRHGLITPQASESAAPFTRFERAAPKKLWQIDFTGQFALDQGRCHPLGVLDDHSRYNLLMAACANQKETTVQRSLRGSFRQHGLLDQIALGQRGALGQRRWRAHRGSMPKAWLCAWPT
jgi:hypothetical protein